MKRADEGLVDCRYVDRDSLGWNPWTEGVPICGHEPDRLREEWCRLVEESRSVGDNLCFFAAGEFIRRARECEDWCQFDPTTATAKEHKSMRESEAYMREQIRTMKAQIWVAIIASIVATAVSIISVVTLEGD